MTKLIDLKNRKSDLEYCLAIVRKEIAEEKRLLSSDREIGNEYGLLKVLELSYIIKRRKYFKCSCKCGKNTIVDLADLRRGKTKSCGCLRRINLGNRFIKPNAIITGRGDANEI